MNGKTKNRLRDLEPYIYLALIIMFTISAVVVIGFYIRQGHQIKRAATTAKAAAVAIQRNRIETIRNDCLDQNGRHVAAVNALYVLLKKSGVKPARRAAAAQPIVNLINALAPYQDCEAVVAAATLKPPPKKPSS